MTGDIVCNFTNVCMDIQNVYSFRSLISVVTWNVMNRYFHIKGNRILAHP